MKLKTAKCYAKSITNAISYIRIVSAVAIATGRAWAIPLVVVGAIVELGGGISNNLNRKEKQISWHTNRHQ